MAMKEGIMKKGIITAVVAVLFLGLSGIAFAGDPTSIVQTSKTHFPIVISAPGSYQLNSNLVVSEPGTTAILVEANDVTIDLNGYSILGPAVCTGCPASCTLTGLGVGIDALTFGVDNLRVSNGVVSGMGAEGIAAFNNAVIENVRAIGNGADGIDVYYLSDGLFSNYFTVRDCISNFNGHDGIDTGVSGLVVENVTDCNGNDGLNLDANVGYGHNVSVGNGNINCYLGTPFDSTNYCP